MASEPFPIPIQYSLNHPGAGNHPAACTALPTNRSVLKRLERPGQQSHLPASLLPAGGRSSKSKELPFPGAQQKGKKRAPSSLQGNKALHAPQNGLELHNQRRPHFNLRSEVSAARRRADAERSGARRGLTCVGAAGRREVVEEPKLPLGLLPCKTPERLGTGGGPGAEGRRPHPQGLPSQPRDEAASRPRRRTLRPPAARKGPAGHPQPAAAAQPPAGLPPPPHPGPSRRARAGPRTGPSTAPGPTPPAPPPRPAPANQARGAGRHRVTANGRPREGRKPARERRGGGGSAPALVDAPPWGGDAEVHSPIAKRNCAANQYRSGQRGGRAPAACPAFGGGGGGRNEEAPSGGAAREPTARTARTAPPARCSPRPQQSTARGGCVNATFISEPNKPGARAGGRGPKLQHGEEGARERGGNGCGPAWGREAAGLKRASSCGPRARSHGVLCRLAGLRHASEPGPQPCMAARAVSGCWQTPGLALSEGLCRELPSARRSLSPPGRTWAKLGSYQRGKQPNGERCARPPSSSASPRVYKGANGVEGRPLPSTAPTTQGTARGRAVVGPRCGRAVQIKVGCECVTAKRSPAGPGDVRGKAPAFLPGAAWATLGKP